MTQITGGQLVARTLKQAGIGTIFTLCGVHIVGISTAAASMKASEYLTCGTSRRRGPCR